MAMNLIPPPPFLGDRNSSIYKKLKLSLLSNNAEVFVSHKEILINLLDDALSLFEVYNFH